MSKCKCSKPAQQRISKKIAKLRREGYSASQASAIAYKYERSHKLGPRGGKKRNPIADEDVQACTAALSFLYNQPELSKIINEEILDVLKEEGLWDGSQVTQKGKNYLGDVEVTYRSLGWEK